MTQATTGQKVKVHYTGKLDDGTVFDSSVGKDPLTFTLGSGEVIAGFNNGVLGLTVNESKTVTIPATEAYGPHQAAWSWNFPRPRFPRT